jgi:hypothetical protein
MTRTVLARALTTSSLAAAALVVGCGVEKSENVLSPSVAGPIAGVEISAPRAVEPSQGARVKHSQQPIRLMIENANTNGQRPLWYTFELASDSGFSSKLFAKTSISPGSDGKTAVQIDKLDLGRPYYWRARAEDGANTGPFTTVQFEVLPQPFLGAPPLLSPINNEKTGSRRPTLAVGTPERNAAVGTVTIEVQAATDQAFANLTYHEAGRETGGQNNFTPGHELPANQQHYWRARATDGETMGPWSVTQGFITAAAPQTPPPGPGPAPGGPCTASTPEAIVSCERAKYGHMSHDQMYHFMKAVAQSLNRNGIGGGPFGILRKQSGTNCNGYSCDVACAGNGGGQRQYDVLGDIDGAQTAGWGQVTGSIRIDICEVQ